MISNYQLTGSVHLLGQFESLRGREVNVGGGDSQNQAVVSRDELHEHVSDLELNIGRLVTHWDLGEPREIHHRQIQDCTHQPGGRKRGKEKAGR